MTQPVPLYDTSYGEFTSEVMRQVRCETYGEDFGQTSWVTGPEYRGFFRLLQLTAAEAVLDVGCGSGGPALFLAREAGCRVTGVDVNAAGLRAGREQARQAGVEDRVQFHQADVNDPLPFPSATFDAIVCLDVLNHLPARGKLFREWLRLLRPGGRVLFTDPVVVTGLVSKDEFAARGSIGHFEFGSPGINERLVREAGFELTATEDVTDNEAEVSGRWHDARQRRSTDLIRLEGEETFAGTQRFLATAHRLTAERRLSRFAYAARKPAA
jgi:SAM-dependent methyltransferase